MLLRTYMLGVNGMVCIVQLVCTRYSEPECTFTGGPPGVLAYTWYFEVLCLARTEYQQGMGYCRQSCCATVRVVGSGVGGNGIRQYSSQWNDVS